MALLPLLNSCLQRENRPAVGPWLPLPRALPAGRLCTLWQGRGSCWGHCHWCGQGQVKQNNQLKLVYRCFLQKCFQWGGMYGGGEWCYSEGRQLLPDHCHQAPESPEDCPGEQTALHLSCGQARIVNVIKSFERVMIAVVEPTCPARLRFSLTASILARFFTIRPTCPTSEYLRWGSKRSLHC